MSKTMHTCAHVLMYRYLYRSGVKRVCVSVHVSILYTQNGPSPHGAAVMAGDRHKPDHMRAPFFVCRPSQQLQAAFKILSPEEFLRQ